MNSSTHPTVDLTANYDRAKLFLRGHLTDPFVLNDTVIPVWMGDSGLFWYERQFRNPAGIVGKQYRLVDIQAETNKALFDHLQLAKSLARASGEDVDSENLPLEQINVALAPRSIEFDAFGKSWSYSDGQERCLVLEGRQALPPTGTLSPDGRRIVFYREFNLWIQDAKSGREGALTTDGTEDYIYNGATTMWGNLTLRTWKTAALWSPDSRRILAVKRDKRQVKSLPMLAHVPSDGSLRPQASEVKVAYPSDKHVETWQLLLIDVESGQLSEVNHPPVASNKAENIAFWDNIAWWSEDSKRVWFIDQERGDQRVRLLVLEVETGSISTVFEERSDTHINVAIDTDTSPLHRFLPASEELIWWSERDGWGHLYLYDLKANTLKRQLTSGAFRVRNVVHIDETRREVWVQTGGRTESRDPYYRDLCKINLDTAELVPVFSKDQELVVHHLTGFNIPRTVNTDGIQQVAGISPDASYIVTTRTRIDQVPETVVLDREGHQLFTVETADLTAVPGGWQWPRPFKVKASDNITDLYGALFLPTDFSEAEKYPVVHLSHHAPWLVATPKGSFHSNRLYAGWMFHTASAIAELGFVVVILDGRGTAARSKAFQDESYGWVPGPSVDYVEGIKQLAERHSYMDLSRVGMYGTGYRSSLQHFLENQDFYSVCVQMFLLDNRVNGAFEGEAFEGLDGPAKDKQYPEDLAKGLKGKLMLVHALNARNSAVYPPVATLRVIDALSKAGKDFDMLSLPQVQSLYGGYAIRRGLDYLVRHLCNVEPPKEFDLGEVTF